MLKKENRLTTRYQYNKVRRLGQKYSAQYFHLYYLDISQHEENISTQVGFIVTKRFHKSAVKRNRVKRIFREVVRQNFDKIKPGYWIVIYPKVKSLEKGYEEINTDFTKDIQNLPIAV